MADIIKITVVCACGHKEVVNVSLEEVGPVTAELEATVCSACMDDIADAQADEQYRLWEAAQEAMFIAEERVCQVCNKVVREESHCHEMTGPLS